MRVVKLAAFSEGSEVAGVSYTPDRLMVKLGVGPSLIFENVIGFRLFDEGDLLEFWPECSAEHGAFFLLNRAAGFRRNLRARASCQQIARVLRNSLLRDPMRASTF